MIRLRDKEIEKLSKILQLPGYAIEKMASLSLINEAIAINMLIEMEYKKLKQTRKYKVRHIFQALMDEYQVSKNKVEAAVYNKRKRTYACTQCGRRIPKSESTRNGGLCDMCVSKSIKL